jgi:hypothetical protein
MNNGRGILKTSLVLLVLLAAALGIPQSKSALQQEKAGATTGVLNPFPGGVGSYWIYKGVVRQQGYKIEEQKVRWRMSVERILRREGATAVVVKGFPDDVDWSSSPPAKESMFVLTDDGGLYRIYSEQGTPDLKFADTRISTADFLKDEDLWFQWPPKVGAQPGGGNCPDRADDMYCWILFEPPEKASLRGIKGAPSGSRTGYTLANRTNPDDTEVDIVSGVGVTGYGYHHHGTVADIDLHLVEVHLTEQK